MSRDRVIGISYNPGEAAPTVVLKGSGEQVSSVLSAARAADVPIVKDSVLAERLYAVPVDAPIGQELFPVMAVLLAQVLDLDQFKNNERPRR